MSLWRDTAWVCAGGALGAGARFLVASLAARLFSPDFPWGTLAVNALGSFGIGVVMQLAASGQVGPPGRLFLAVGVLGGFTTFSTFSYETLRLWQAGTAGLAVVNAGGQLILCLGATALGLWAGRALG